MGSKLPTLIRQKTEIFKNKFLYHTLMIAKNIWLESKDLQMIFRRKGGFWFFLIRIFPKEHRCLALCNKV